MNRPSKTETRRYRCTPVHSRPERGLVFVKILVIVFCGCLIGLALYLFVRSLRKMAKGRCCEGCAGCAQAENCSILHKDASAEGEDTDERGA